MSSPIPPVNRAPTSLMTVHFTKDNLGFYCRAHLLVLEQPFFWGCPGCLLERVDFSSCGAWAQQLQLNCPVVCGILAPRPGIKPALPELEGGFLNHQGLIKEACKRILILFLNYIPWKDFILQSVRLSFQKIFSYLVIIKLN